MSSTNETNVYALAIIFIIIVVDNSKANGKYES